MRKNNAIRLPVTIMRGGTSRGVYILETDLPENRDQWDALLLRLMEAPTRSRSMAWEGLSP